MTILRRREFLLASGAVLASRTLRAQTRRARIGLLQTTSVRLARHLVDAFQKRLADLGWREGQNYDLVVREAEGDPARYAPMAVELIAEKPDLLFVPFWQSALTVKKLDPAIPVVFISGEDPVAIGLVASLARPGGNFTGPSVHDSGIYQKGLQLLAEFAPAARTVGVFSFRKPAVDVRVSEQNRMLAEAALSLGIRIVHTSVSAIEQVPAGIQELLRQGARAYFGWLQFWAQRRALVDAVNAARLPSFFTQVEYVEDGGLLWTGTPLAESYRHAAVYVDKILRGAKPAELPVEAPTRIELVVNKRTAGSLGLRIPPAILLRADRVIE